MPVNKHTWTLPDDLKTQVSKYKKMPNIELLVLPLAFAIEKQMGNFNGYTPADVAEDLKNAEGKVLLKDDDSIVVKNNEKFWNRK